MNDRQPIRVVAADPIWPAHFRTYAHAIRQTMGQRALRIDHIGSTAVAGLAAKPIIDIQIAVADFEPFASIKQPLETLGYRWQTDNDDLTKRYFRETPPQPRTHIHVRRLGSWSEQFALLFRDYLRVNAAARDRYAQEKQRLAALYEFDREAYTTSKTPIIWQIIQAASEWSQQVGWQPAASDA